MRRCLEFGATDLPPKEMTNLPWSMFVSGRLYIYIHTYDPVLTPPQRIIYIYIYTYTRIYTYTCIIVYVYIYKHHLYTDLPKFWFPSTTNDFTNSPRYTSLHRTCPSKHRRLLQHASQISFDLRGSKKVKKTKDGQKCLHSKKGKQSSLSDMSQLLQHVHQIMVDFTGISLKSKYSSHFVLAHSPPQIRWGEMVRWLKKQDLHLPRHSDMIVHVLNVCVCVCVCLCSSELINLCDYYTIFSTKCKIHTHINPCTYIP